MRFGSREFVPLFAVTVVLLHGLAPMHCLSGGQQDKSMWRDVNSLATASAGRRIVSGSLDHTVRLWEVSDRQILSRGIIGRHDDRVWSVAVSADGSRVVSGSLDGVARLWWLDGDSVVGSTNLLASVVDHEGGHRSPHAVAISPDGNTVAVSTADRLVRVWDIGGDHISFLAQRPAGETDMFPPISSASVSIAGGTRAIATHIHEGEVRLWRWDGKGYATREPSLQFRHPQVQARNGVVEGLITHIPQSDLVMFDTDALSWSVWDLKDDQPQRIADFSQDDVIEAVTASADGTLVAGCGSGGKVRVWRVGSWELLLDEELEHDLHSITFSPDGDAVLVGTSEGLIVFVPIPEGEE